MTQPTRNLPAGMTGSAAAQDLAKVEALQPSDYTLVEADIVALDAAAITAAGYELGQLLVSSDTDRLFRIGAVAAKPLEKLRLDELEAPTSDINIADQSLLDAYRVNFRGITIPTNYTSKLEVGAGMWNDNAAGLWTDAGGTDVTGLVLTIKADPTAENWLSYWDQNYLWTMAKDRQETYTNYKKYAVPDFGGADVKSVFEFFTGESSTKASGSYFISANVDPGKAFQIKQSAATGAALPTDLIRESIQFDYSINRWKIPALNFPAASPSNYVSQSLAGEGLDLTFPSRRAGDLAGATVDGTLKPMWFNGDEWLDLTAPPTTFNGLVPNGHADKDTPLNGMSASFVYTATSDSSDPTYPNGGVKGFKGYWTANTPSASTVAAVRVFEGITPGFYKLGMRIKSDAQVGVYIAPYDEMTVPTPQGCLHLQNSYMVLAADLNPGATTISVVDATPYGTAPVASSWWANGIHVHDPGVEPISMNDAGYGGSNNYQFGNFDHTFTYAAAAPHVISVAGNTLTLDNAWDRDTLTAGTMIRRAFFTSTYARFNGPAGYLLPASADWKQYTQTIFFGEGTTRVDILPRHWAAGNMSITDVYLERTSKGTSDFTVSNNTKLFNFDPSTATTAETARVLATLIEGIQAGATRG